MKYILSLLVFVLPGISANAQSTVEDYYNKIQVNEPNSINPFGQRNEQAPKEIAEFDFMIGVCHCTDSILNRDGSYLVYPSIWKAKYILNGYAIQDNNFNARNPTTNLRLYDPSSKTWKVTYLQSATGYFTGVWEGKMEGGEIVLTAHLNGNLSRLIFYNITNKGYNWRSETVKPDGNVVVGWRKNCVKQMP